MFSLADRLPSEPSADDLPSLFRLFAGTSRPSDSLPPFMLDFWFMHLLQPARSFHFSGADLRNLSLIQVGISNSVRERVESNLEKPLCLIALGKL
jgi:hypothetical protein